MSLSPAQLLPAPAATQYVVAYSGGLDSTVLLHLAHKAGLTPLSAVHIHHGLQATADDWARHCQAQCEAWGITLQVQRLTIAPQHPQGPEAAAREARYVALRAGLPAGAVLLTAHHANDQAETLLLRLLRGTGVEGLVGMPALAPLPVPGSAPTTGQPVDPLRLWRPLLRQPREALEAYAEREGLRWVEDPHNQAPRYARSWLRHAVMPLLQSRWPDAREQLARTADHAADAAALLAGLAAQLMATVQQGSDALSVSGLLALKPPERRLVLRHWLLPRLGAMPPAVLLHHIERDVLGAGPSATPLLCWQHFECRRYRNALYAGPALEPVPEHWAADWDGTGPLTLPAGLGTLHSATPAPLQVRFGLPGLRLKLKGHAQHASLKNLCQTAGVPPWWRYRLPIVLLNSTVVSVAAHWNTAEAPALTWRHGRTWGLPPLGDQ